MIKRLHVTVLLLMMAFSILSCAHKQPRYHPGGPYYYISWASYFQPYRPSGEISEKEAKDLENKSIAYYVAYFYETGLIKAFEKVYGGERYKTEYFYDNERVVKEISIGLNRNQTKEYFYDKERVTKIKITVEKDGKKNFWIWDSKGIRRETP